ncbi:TetR/AcrR family transcriptional regulator [Microbacterium sp. H1-D42]|uniref:TetR/AcrR family transcriptional regulator n=1 Tax=Microbacterium sp. H1-D42 TaxID=2925844 RepID=UPI001F52E013|nr:TetR/AcrR family transcriptional regulator [Microbacterium sp. H1-D42]UNK70622.1 TetR/AcrR family transcriptional regulator [Microbacterium sp. H1-D42]
MHSQDDRAIRQLWGLEAPTVRGPKARWTTAEVSSVAVDLADEIGLESLSLARVAARLEMTTTALYRYVGSKAELVELMVDAAIGDPPEITASDWRERCRVWVRHLAGVYAAHPWLSDVAPTRLPVQPRAYAWIDALVTAITDDVQADPLRIALLLDSLTRTYAAMERSLTAAAPAPWLSDAVAKSFPRLSVQREAPDARTELTFAVDTVLRGLD